MAQLTASEIMNLCDQWCAASLLPGGGVSTGSHTEKFRLLENGVVFHELSYDAFTAALVGTSKTLLGPRMGQYVCADHVRVWEWCGELLLGPTAKLFPEEQNEIRRLCELALRKALPRFGSDTGDLYEALENSSLILTYLSFPLLEAILKRACAAYVGFNGTVKAPFSKSRKGGKEMYEVGDICSSLCALLHLHHDHVADTELRLLIGHFREHIHIIDATMDPFDRVYRWRNQSLHGATAFQTIGGIVLNYALLILLAELKTGFDQRRDEAYETCRLLTARGKNPWTFYSL